jgi:hypothetical protein
MSTMQTAYSDRRKDAPMHNDRTHSLRHVPDRGEVSTGEAACEAIA